jgi:phosphate transport system substrate-binding protein
MKRIDPSDMLAFAIALMTFSVGTAFLVGLIGPVLDTRTRVIFGLVFVLMGIYRFVVTLHNKRFKEREREEKANDRNLGTWIWILLAVGLIRCSQVEESPTRGKLVVFVPESHAALFNAEAEEFGRLYPDAQVTVAAVLSDDAAQLFIGDSIRAVALDRKLTDKEKSTALEKKVEIEELVVAKDALAVVVNKLNDMESLSLDTLRAIFSGKLSRWDKISASGLTGPVATISTGAGSGIRSLVTRFMETESFKPVVEVTTQKQAVAWVAERPDAIGLVSWTCFRDSALTRLIPKLDQVKVLAISGKDSTGHFEKHRLHQYNMYEERYPLTYPVIMYFNSKKSTLAAGFTAFTASAPGQKIFLNWGLVPMKMPIRLVQIKS